MGDAGLGKFQSYDGWRFWFETFGYPAWLSPVVGALELIGACLIIVPRLAPYSAMMLSVIMLGALESVLTHETDLGWEDPVIHLVLLAIIGAAHWKRRWRPGGTPAPESPVSPT